MDVCVRACVRGQSFLKQMFVILGFTTCCKFVNVPSSLAFHYFPIKEIPFKTVYCNFILFLLLLVIHMEHFCWNDLISAARDQSNIFLELIHVFAGKCYLINQRYASRCLSRVSISKLKHLSFWCLSRHHSLLRNVSFIQWTSHNLLHFGPKLFSLKRKICKAHAGPELSICATFTHNLIKHRCFNANCWCLAQ